MASMYGKRDFANWFNKQKEKGNVLYKNENKESDYKALAGLQLPSLYSESDPLFNNSINVNSQNVNTDSKNSTKYMNDSEGITNNQPTNITEQVTFEYNNPNEELNFKNVDDNYKDHVVEHRGEEKERGYSKSVVEKTDLPDNVVNEFIEKPEMYNVLKNADVKAEAENIIQIVFTDMRYISYKYLKGKVRERK